MTRGLDVDGVRELAVLERSGLAESRHLGAAVIVDADGAILQSLGDVRSLIYPRSSLKPLQAVAVSRSGARLEGERLVLSAASHAATAEHVRVVQAMLAAAGHTEEDLQCPPDWPLDAAAAAQARVHGARRRVTMNCSGKHASFLMACAVNGWATDDYLDPLHPLQLLIRDTVEGFAGERVEHFGTDGCGAPVFALTLRGLATAISRVARAEDEHTARLTAAIRRHPWAIDGPGRSNTVVIQELGLIAKGGAEGVMVMAASDGTAVALKMLDGSLRAATLVALELLARLGVIDRTEADRVIQLTTERVLGGGSPVGVLRASF